MGTKVLKIINFCVVHRTLEQEIKELKVMFVPPSTQEYTVHSLLTDTSIRRTPGVGPFVLFSIILLYLNSL